MIYVIQAGKNGPVKIGYTDNDIEKRIAQLQVGCPYELVLLWKYYEGTMEDEAKIHSDLLTENIRGEWFHPSKKVFRYIDERLSNDTEIYLQKCQDVLFVSEGFDGTTYINFEHGEVIFNKDGIKSASRKLGVVK